MTEPSPRIRVEVASVTDRGMNEKRPLNQDSMLSDEEHGIFAVADGVGGGQAGEVASETAVEVLQQAFVHHQEGDDIEDLMEIAIQRANASIYQMSREDPRFAMMATTIVALHLDGLRATVGHVGDSRLYRLTPDGQLQRETDDHSVVEEEVRAGRMTAQQAANHPSRNVISRALGAEQAVEVDMKTFEFDEGTTFLLCSDGITRHIPDEELVALLRNASDLENVCAEMKRLCYERGAEDNLTAIIVRVGAPASLSAPAPAEVDGEFDEEQTLIRRRAAFADVPTAPLEPAPPSLLQRPFAGAGAADSPAAASFVPARDSASTSHDAQAAAPARQQRGGGGGRVIVGLLLLAAVAAAAFYGGLRFGRGGGLTGAATTASPVASPSATPTPESADERFDRLRRRVDLAPAIEAARIETETGNQPLNSTDPEQLYLYGRAMLLTNKSREAVSAFEKTIERIKENETARNGQLRIDTRLAEIAANLRSEDFNKARDAAKALGDEVVRPAGTEAPANTSPSPAVTPF
ncbi:MAG TPA: PP2C family serine/threonine-protein phosphatase [Pyrinomonadaceae bacterium]